MQSQHILEITIPRLPTKIEPSHIKEDNSLLTKSQISFYMTYIAKSGGKHSKKLISSQFSPFSYMNRHFAVYWGGKHDEYGDEEFGKALGIGYYGSVKIAQDMHTKEWFALKVQTDLALAKNEEEILDELEYLIRTSNNKPIAFETYSLSKKKVQHYMLMKLIHGFDLFIIKNKRYSFNRLLDIGIKAAQRLSFLHQKYILHCDIKLENIMYDPLTDKIELIDFGFAGKMNEKGFLNKKEFKGTLGYCAPELFKKQFIYTTKTDSYAFGCVLAELFRLATYIYTDQTNKVIKEIVLIKENSLHFKNSIISDIEIRRNILHFIQKMLATNPGERPTMNEVTEFLISIQKKLYTIQQKRTVGILDIDDYLSVKNTLFFAPLIQKLKKYDEIQLIQQQAKQSIQEYSLLLHELERMGVTVQNKIYHSKDKKNLALRIADRLDFKHPNIYCCSKIDPRGSSEILTKSRIRQSAFFAGRKRSLSLPDQTSHNELSLTTYQRKKSVK